MLQRPTDDTRTGLNPQIHPFCSYPMGQSQSQSVFYHQELQQLHGTKGFSVGSDGKESASNVGDLGSIPISGRSPGERHGNSTPAFLPGESMDRGAWQAAVHGVAKSGTLLTD